MILSERERHQRVHSAISHLIMVEQELEGVSREHEVQAAELRHCLYSLLDLAPRDTAGGGDSLRLDPETVDEVCRRYGDGTADPLEGTDLIRDLDPDDLEF